MKRMFKKLKDVDEEDDLFEFGVAILISAIFSIAVFFLAE